MNDPAGAGVAGLEGVEEPNVKLGVLVAGAAAVLAGESSIISPPDPAAAAGTAPKPPNPPELAVAAGAGAPNVNPPLLLAGLAGAGVVDAPNVNVPLGVVVPDAGVEEAASEDGLGAPNVNVAAGLDSGAGLLPVLLGAPKVNPPEAGFAASPETGLGAPNVNPPEEEDAVSAVLEAPKPLLSVEGLPKEKPPLDGSAVVVGLGASSPFAPKKFGTLLGFAVVVVASSFFSVDAAAGGASKVKPEEAGAEACEAAEAPNEKLGMVFLAAGSESSSAPRLDPVEAFEAGGAPKLNPPEAGDVLDDEPKNDGLLAAAGSSFFSWLARKDPNGLLAGAGVAADSVAGLAPKVNGAGLPAAASLAVLLGVAALPNEKPPLEEEAAGEGASVDLLSNFFMVLPKKLGTGPSFLPSVSDFEAGSAGLLKKSEVEGAADFFDALSSGLEPLLGAALAPKLNLGILSAEL